MSSSKALVNNVAAPRLVTHQIQQSTPYIQVYTLPSVTTCTVSHSLGDTVDVCDAVWLSGSCLEAAVNHTVNLGIMSQSSKQDPKS